MTRSGHKDVNMVIVVPPAGVKTTVYPPYGAMYVAASLIGRGYKAAILNIDAERISLDVAIKKIVQMDPQYIAFSGIVAPSYRFIKEMSLRLRSIFPDKIQILGGGLASAVAPVFKNTSIDIVVQSEGDITAGELLDCLGRRAGLDGVRGIYYRQGGSYQFTGRRELVRNLDSLPYPAFDLVDMDRYMPDGAEFIGQFIAIKDDRILSQKRKRMITIPTSRGCFGTCTFCFRAYQGIRVHSIKYVFDLVEHCIEKFNVGFFTFGDECFAPNKARNWEFIEEYRRRKSDFVFRILGMRVDTVDKEILKAYKDIRCWMIEYGFESGSQKMLDVINKRVSVEKNAEVARWTMEAGIHTSPTLVLAMPGETNDTVRESIEFMKSLDLEFKQYQWSYALPIPGSPLYEFARISGAIQDEDEYLSSLEGPAAVAGVPHVNLTDESDGVVAGWGDRVRDAVDGHYFRRKFGNILIARIARLIMLIQLHWKKGTLAADIWAKYKRSMRSVGIPGRKETREEAKIVRFRKRPDLRVGDLLKSAGGPVSLVAVNRMMAERESAHV